MTAWFHWHDWNEWKVVERAEIAVRVIPEETPRVIGSYLRQERTCKTCGFVQMDQQRVTI